MDPCVVRPDSETELYTEERCSILESWNNPDDPEASIARARVRPGVTTRRHLLIGIQERYLIVQGEGVVVLGSLPPGAVGPGDVVVIPPGVPQQITNTGSADLIFYAICTPRFTWANYRALDRESPGSPAKRTTPLPQK